jgi:hypothetical protein
VFGQDVKRREKKKKSLKLLCARDRRQSNRVVVKVKAGGGSRVLHSTYDEKERHSPTTLRLIQNTRSEGKQKSSPRGVSSIWRWGQLCRVVQPAHYQLCCAAGCEAGSVVAHEPPLAL